MPLEFMPLSTFLDQPLWGEADGFNGAGLDSEGYDRNGLDPETGLDRDGYDADGLREDRYGILRDREGYDTEGFNADGRDRAGLDEGGYDIDGYDVEGFDEDGWDEDGENRYGESRYEDDDDDYSDRSGFWQSTPTYIFKSTTEEKREAEREGRYTEGKRLSGVPYFGMEIELTSDCNDEVRRIIHREYEGLVWAVQDCSVEGFEMVTHPMTAAWAARHFPWEIVEELGKAGCEVWPESNGLHIHVSRAGFKNWAHQLRWVKMFYSIQDKIAGYEGMAGRDATEWGTFTGGHRKGQFEAFREKMARANGHRYERRDGTWLPRYCALNLQNTGTIEARVFSATVDAGTLRMRFELMASTVEYTRDQTIADIRNGGWEYETYLAWLIKNEASYPALVKHVVPERTLA